MAVELATAYISLVPSTDKLAPGVNKALGGVDSQGAGRKISDGLMSGISGRSAAIAGAVGGIFAGIANNVAGSISALFGQAVQMSDATEKFTQTMKFAGVTTGLNKALKATRSYADSTVYDLATIQNTTAQLAANGVKNYTGLTEAAGNLNAVAGGNQDTFKSVAMVLTQTAGAGKLTTENWNQLSDAIPGASGQLQKALLQAGAYTGNFRDAMSKGMITSDEFNAALLKLGTKPVAVQAAKSVSTMEGSVGNLSASITGVLADAFTTVKPVITGFTNILAGFISNSDIFIPVIAGIGAAIGAALIPPLVGAIPVVWAFTAALLANPLTWIVVGIGALVAGIVLLWRNWDQVTKFITVVWGKFVGWVTDITTGLANWWNGLWSGVGKWFSDVWRNIGVAVKIAMLLVQGTIRTITGTIRNIWNGIWSGISSFFIGVWNKITGTVRGIQGVFRSVFGALGGIIRGAFNGVLGFVKGTINNIIRTINGIIGGINGVAGAIGKAIGINIHIPSIPLLAQGGIVKSGTGGTIARIGEGRYDEAVIPLGGQQFKRLADALGRNDDSSSPAIYVQSPLTGEYLLAKVADVADERIARAMPSSVAVTSRFDIR